MKTMHRSMHYVPPRQDGKRHTSLRIMRLIWAIPIIGLVIEWLMK